MFGQRDKRVVRRQRTLEELLWLDPVERERRIIAAVAAGDFTAEEVDASLRLVMRLDKLRGMDLPATGRLIGASDASHGTALSSDEVEVGFVEQTAEDENSDTELPEGELIGIPVVAEQVEISVVPEYVGVPVMPESHDEANADMPIDALESAERWLERGHHASVSPAIARRAAEARAEWDMPVEAGSIPPADEVGPTISWLRPN